SVVGGARPADFGDACVKPPAARRTDVLSRRCELSRANPSQRAGARCREARLLTQAANGSHLRTRSAASTAYSRWSQMTMNIPSNGAETSFRLVRTVPIGRLTYSYRPPGSRSIAGSGIFTRYLDIETRMQHRGETLRTFVDRTAWFKLG